MPYNLCITDDEIDNLIKILQKENENWNREKVLKAIKACCDNPATNEVFNDCIKLLLRQYDLMDY
jgi:hypothetical protein